MVKLSIVITFYNNSKYIDNCIKNISFITDPAIEILIMDDGSEEKEYEIIKSKILSLKKKNIRIGKNDVNKGAGYTKNKAVNLAKGEYIIFLDCDDYVDKNYYSKILSVISTTNADIICTDIATKIDDKIFYESLTSTSIIREKAKKIDDNVYEISGRKLLGNKFSASACNKALKREYLIKFPFNENKCDDLTAIIPAICKSTKIIYIERINYYYCQTNNSITRQKKGKNKTKNLIDSIDSLLKTFDILKSEEIIESNIEVFYANNVIPFIYFSILNNDFKNCLISLKYFLASIDENNYADYLIVKNPYLYRLTYLDYYSTNLLNEIKKQNFIKLSLKLFIDRIKYRLIKVFRRS